MTTADHLVAVLLVLVWPGYGFMTHARTLRAIANDASGRERIKTYRSKMAREWAAAIVVLLVWLASGRPWADLGLGAPGGRGFLIGIAIPVAAAAFYFTQLVALSKNAALRADFQTTVAGGAGGSSICMGESSRRDTRGGIRQVA